MLDSEDTITEEFEVKGTRRSGGISKDGIKVGAVFRNMLVIATGFLQFGKSWPLHWSLLCTDV